MQHDIEDAKQRGEVYTCPVCRQPTEPDAHAYFFCVGVKAEWAYDLLVHTQCGIAADIMRKHGDSES